MSRAGDCWDNSVAEIFFGALKTELVYHQEYETRVEVKSDIFEWIDSSTTASGNTPHLGICLLPSTRL